jgi:glycosyltransferase involved in cell wall biosynthesis
MHDLSLIIPVYNEAKNLPILYDSIQQTLKANKNIWEVIFVDDGSMDDSFEVLKSLVEKDPSIAWWHSAQLRTNRGDY